MTKPTNAAKRFHNAMFGAWFAHGPSGQPAAHIAKRAPNVSGVWKSKPDARCVKAGAEPIVTVYARHVRSDCPCGCSYRQEGVR